VLYLLIEELPEHKALLTALRALQAEGVELLLPEHVLDETVGHVQRADKTFRRFADNLIRLPEAVVTAQVWHAIVRGYYYAMRGGFQGSPTSYWSKYHDPNRPAEFIEHTLSRRLRLRRIDLSAFSADDEATCHALEAEVLPVREKSRLKALFRDADFMLHRVRDDICMILSLAAKQDPTVGAPATGYLASEDRAFGLIESHATWRPRPKVWIRTRTVPELASFVCAAEVGDDDLVRLLFDPIVVAAAEHLGAEISFLASIGVDMKGVPLDRLSWDLTHVLRDEIAAFKDAARSEEPDADTRAAQAALATAKTARDAGYELTGPVSTLVGSYEAALATAESERARSKDLQDKLEAFAAAARGALPKKSRRRINGILRELGIRLDLPEEGGGEESGAQDQ
jgi:hypothetical protein